MKYAMNRGIARREEKAAARAAAAQTEKGGEK